MRLPQSEIDVLVSELEYRKNTLREDINKDVNDAAALGDLPENFPYDAAVAERTRNETRIQDIEDILREVKNTSEAEFITIGSEITIKQDNNVRKIILVDSETISKIPKQGYVSIDSPLGKELVNKKIGDLIKVSAPIGEIEYLIIDIV